ncbi:PadR family transcriptional regulator [Arthrobacter pascens]|uniref:PadR family transcriptional regulator n=1 Tax=Arthrobacter pascens TaxID=1677 RepID=UPI00196B9441|nr:helix-turn-helix transcriptional regulator [Arthrobacter pascens]MBN3498160.1 helix-turn-helix transcriptional regulator [Arthrobacter pascens]MDR6556619.1 DNA-binding PadR family transcriptional regulator [Arthrobacter pascens]
MAKEKELDGTLKDWESVFRQGLLTFWTFVALDAEWYDVASLKNRIKQLTNGTYDPADQTLYRQLRRHLDVGLVELRLESSPAGPPKKLYRLSERGRRVLEQFAYRNIQPFSQPEVQNVIERIQT